MFILSNDVLNVKNRRYMNTNIKNNIMESATLKSNSRR